MSLRNALFAVAVIVFIAVQVLAQSTAAVVPVVGSADGINGSHFKTALQLHNASSLREEGQLVFVCPEIESNTESIDYSLAPGETKVYADVVADFRTAGLGSIDIRPLIGPVPAVIARIEGRASGSSPAYTEEEQGIEMSDVITAATTTVLVAPTDLAGSRWNIGLRTFDRGATMKVTVRSANGAVVRSFDKAFAPNSFVHESSAVFLDGNTEAGDSAEIYVSDGSAVIYGATTDNVTQQPALHMSQRINYVHGMAGTSVQMIPTDNPQIFSTPWHGTAWLSGLGNFSAAAEQTVDFSVTPPATSTTATFLFANGDALHLSGSGVSLAPDAQGIVNFEGLFAITSGTGRFANATGTIRFEGGAGITPQLSNGFFTLSGTFNAGQ